MYLSDKNVKMTLRMSDAQKAFLVEIGELYGGKSPSEVLRMIIDGTMATYYGAKDVLEKNGESGGMSNENIKTDKHDFV